MIRRLFNQKINSITMAAFLVAMSSLISRLLGIFRDRILAGQFGAGDTLDVYYAAFRIPDLIFNLIVLGALSAGFVPIFTNLIKDKKDHPVAWQLVNYILNIVLLVTGGLAVVGIIFAPQLMHLITPGFSPEKLEQVVVLTRIMFISPVILGLSSVLGGSLQSFKRFFAYSLSPIFYNLGIIIGALYLVPVWGVYGLAWGVVGGSVLHAVIQMPTLISLGWHYRWEISWRSVQVKNIFKMMTARTLTLAINQLNLVVITIIASTLASGSLSVFNLANNLQSFPIGIFGISFAIAVFPTLSAHAFDRQKLIMYFSRTLRQILFFIVPATVLILALRAQLVRVILGSGQFDWQDTVMTINTLAYFSLSLFAQATLPLLVRVFYARHDSKTPFYLGLVSVAVNILLSWQLAPSQGVAGLALAFSISSILNFALLLVALRWEVGALDEGTIIKSILKFTVAALLAAVAVQAMKVLVWPYTDMTKVWGVLLQGGVAGLFGLTVYVGICSLLRSQELFDFWYSFKNRLLSKKEVKTGDQSEARGI
ncbi:MAG: murein biosynthesis integral membrane protein MurJ [bacterium]